MGSGKTALVQQLCLELRERLPLAVVTNDIFTREDAEYLVRAEVHPLRLPLAFSEYTAVQPLT